MKKVGLAVSIAVALGAAGFFGSALMAERPAPDAPETGEKLPVPVIQIEDLPVTEAVRQPETLQPAGWLWSTPVAAAETAS